MYSPRWVAEILPKKDTSAWLIFIALFIVDISLSDKLSFMLPANTNIIYSWSLVVAGWPNCIDYYTFGDNPNQMFPLAYSRAYSQLLRMSGMIKLPAIIAKNVTTNTLVSIPFIHLFLSVFYRRVMCGCRIEALMRWRGLGREVPPLYYMVT